MRGEGNNVMSTEYKGSVYINLLLEFAPLFGVAFSILMLKGLRSVKASYMGQTIVSRLVNLVLTSIIGAVLAVGCAALLPLIYPQATDAALVGATVVMTIGGVRLMDGLAYKYFKIHLVDSSDMNPADSVWLTLSDRERRECMELWRRRAEGDGE